jgi:FG-GAP repeat
LEKPHHPLPRFGPIAAAHGLSHPNDLVAVHQQRLGFGIAAQPGEDLAQQRLGQRRFPVSRRERLRVGDIDGVQAADLVWVNSVNGCIRRAINNGNGTFATKVAQAGGLTTGDFTFPAGIQTHPTTPGVGWLPYDQVFVGDVNADGKADIVWTNPSGDARVYGALAK